MPEQIRGPDFLYLQNVVSRRVSNLETGVHPTRAEYSTDALGPTVLEDVSGTLRQPFTLQNRLSWSRRQGLGMLSGFLQFDSGKTHDDLVSGEIVGVLPPQVRPLTGLRPSGQITVAPWVFQFTIGTDGSVAVIKPAAAAGSTYNLYFDGVSWAVT